ncbi:Protein FAM13A [Sarcoptes scabiei]|uniref:Protein FAM13A n=1 Tax=Sarcoptes scabiei TaxID=52283 RepID=A0A834R378_SARSC|nr:Protein FAM13A [Sarcoptes scabiei]
MKSRIRRISASVDTALISSSSSSEVIPSGGGNTNAGIINTGLGNVNVINEGCDSSSTTEINQHENFGSQYGPNNPSSKSLDICGTESRIERMRKLLSSPLLKRKNASHNSGGSSGCGQAFCSSHHHHHHSHYQHYYHCQSSPQSNQLPRPPSSPSSSSSPALVASDKITDLSMKTFGVSLESLSNHHHPHHQQPHHPLQFIDQQEYYVRDPEQIIVPHQKAAHILGQACPGCLTSGPSNSSSTGSINETQNSSGHFSPYGTNIGGFCGNQTDDMNSSFSSIVASTTSSGNSSSSTSSASSIGGVNSSCLIPFIVTRLCTYIENQGGMVQEGLFRISGNAKLVDKLKQSFDRYGDAPLESEGDLASAAALLKQFLRELPQPLIPNGSQFLDVIRSLKNNRETCVLSLKALISQLPDENYYTLRYLIRFLNRIAQRNEENRMTSTNLSIVFAPNIFRVCVDTFQGLKDQSAANEVVNLLIREFAEIFNDTSDGGCHSIDRADSYGDFSCESDLQFSINSNPDIREDDNHKIFGEKQSDSGNKSTDENEQQELTTDVDSTTEYDSVKELAIDLNQRRRSYQQRKPSQIDDLDQNRCQSFDQPENVDSNNHKFFIRHLPKRCNSEEMYLQTSNNDRRFSIKKDDRYRRNSHSHEIIITNSSDSVSTDDNTTTATSTGPTICSVIIGIDQIDLDKRKNSNNSQSGDVTDISDDNFGNSFVPDYSKLLMCDMTEMRGARSSSYGSDCTENIMVQATLSFASEDDEDDSLLKSIASDCSNNNTSSSDDKTDQDENHDEKNDRNRMNADRTIAVEEEQSTRKGLTSKNQNEMVILPSNTITTSQISSVENEGCDAAKLEADDDKKASQESPTRNSIKIDSNIAKQESKMDLKFNADDKTDCGSDNFKNDANQMPSSSKTPKDIVFEQKSRNRRLKSIRRKINQFEIDFEKENGFKASFENKMVSSFTRPLMLELSSLLNLDMRNLKDLEYLRKESECFDYIVEDFDHSNPRFEERKLEKSFAPTTIEITDSAKMSNDEKRSILNEQSHYTTDYIFNTIFGSKREKNLAKISEMMSEIQRTLNEKRIQAKRPESLDSMTVMQIFDEKLALQKALLRFEALLGRPSCKSERDIVRPVYDRYRLVKRYASKYSQKSISKSDNNNDLQPILENVPMHFAGSSSTASTMKSSNNDEKSSMETSLESSSKSNTKSIKNYHCMSRSELIELLQEYRQQKRNLRSVLRTFENDFQKKTGRRVEKEDKNNMSSVYSCYKNMKGKIRLIEALISKKNFNTDNE